MLGGALLGCVLLALMMANAGGAWDNAKKYVEKGNLGGKGSDVHTATVVGDTVGDPFKDTSGPSMNILINVMAIVSLVIAPLLWRGSRLSDPAHRLPVGRRACASLPSPSGGWARRSRPGDRWCCLGTQRQPWSSLRGARRCLSMLRFRVLAGIAAVALAATALPAGAPAFHRRCRRVDRNRRTAISRRAWRSPTTTRTSVMSPISPRWFPARPAHPLRCSTWTPTRARC